MDTSYVVLGFCLFAWVYAQPNPEPTNIFYDLGTGIFNNDSEVVTNDSDFRSLCSVGSTLYHTAGGNIYRNGSLFREVGFTIQAMACCCNFIAIAYKDDNNTTMVSVTELESSPSITIKLNLEAAGGVALDFCKNGNDTWLVVVSQTTLYKYDVDALTEGDVATVSGLSLVSTPRCVSCYFDSSTMLTYIFVTFNVQSAAQRLTLNYDEVTDLIDFQVFGAFIFNFPFPGGISCVDIEDEYIYFALSISTGDLSTTHRVDRYPIAKYLTPPPISLMELEECREVVASGDDTIPTDSNANGLSVCGRLCQDTSACDASCDCESPCGVCFSGGNGECQCSNSLQENCCYSDSDDAASCIVQVPGVDAFCMVKNHVAMRREGDSVDIVGVTREPLMQEITVKRVVRTGRWKILPFGSAMVDRSNGSLTAEGRSFPVRSSARGMRFGLFAVSVTPSDPRLPSEWIPCIATERSGFLNKIFSATISKDESAMLQATFNKTRLLRFESMVQWRYTPVDSTSMHAMTPHAIPVGIDHCRGSLQCPASGMRGTAAYECYRPRRDPRTWHPIFLVCVRDCPAGMFGPPLCNRTCPNCLNGVCDENNGLCNCYPGFNGTNCESSCPKGFIGRDCDIACGAVYSECDDCSNMLICPAGKVGCQCYPGLKSPFCDEACPAGYWGTNCMEKCETPLCNPRTGGAM